MDRETLRKLEMLNQLCLTEQQKDDVISFFAKRDADATELDDIATENTERMVHVMPVMTVIREDVAAQPFTRDELQMGAPDTDSGYWCVPRVLE